MNQPIVSVVMPTYNGGKYIRQAVDSVFAQEVPLELFIIEDGSTDNTEEILGPYMERENFHYIKNEKNLGVAGSRNRGIQSAKGEYIAFLDSDDWWEKGKLKKQLERIQSSGCVLCSTGRELIHPDGSSAGKYIPVRETISYQNLLKHNSINCSSVLVRRDAMVEFPMEHDDSHEDYLSWLKILKKYGNAVGINEPYLKYRLSEGGKSRNKWKSARMTYQVYRYMGFGMVKSTLLFVSYALHGLWKYR